MTGMRESTVRVHLFRLGEAVHVLALSMHHIISDDWSMSVFAREAMVLYEARAYHRLLCRLLADRAGLAVPAAGPRLRRMRQRHRGADRGLR